MTQLTDLLLIIDKNDFKPEDELMMGITPKQAENILFNILPLSFHEMFKSIIKDRDIVSCLYWATFPNNHFEEIELTIGFPYVEINGDKCEITWHFINKDGESDVETWDLTLENINKSLN